MSIEQNIVRWVFVIPSLLLVLLFLPINGGGYQFLGILDVDFLTSQTLDYMLVGIELVVLIVAAVILEQFAKPKSSRV